MRIPKIFEFDLLLRSYLFIPKLLFRKAIKKEGHVITGKTLDIGAGLKPFLGFFKSSKYTTLDHDEFLNPDVVGNILDLPFSDNTFDSIICLEVLEHVADICKALSEVARVLKPSGMLMISAPMHWPLHYEPYDYWRFTNYGFRELLKHDYTIKKEIKIGGLFSFLGARVAEKTSLFFYHLFPFLPRRARYALGHIANIPLSIMGYIVSMALDPLFKEDAISWIILAQKNDIRTT